MERRLLAALLLENVQTTALSNQRPADSSNCIPHVPHTPLRRIRLPALASRALIPACTHIAALALHRGRHSCAANASQQPRSELPRRQPRHQQTAKPPRQPLSTTTASSMSEPRTTRSTKTSTSTSKSTSASKPTSKSTSKSKSKSSKTDESKVHKLALKGSSKIVNEFVSPPAQLVQRSPDASRLTITTTV